MNDFHIRVFSPRCLIYQCTINVGNEDFGSQKNYQMSRKFCLLQMSVTKILLLRMLHFEWVSECDVCKCVWVHAWVCVCVCVTEWERSCEDRGISWAVMRLSGQLISDPPHPARIKLTPWKMWLASPAAAARSGRTFDQFCHLSNQLWLINNFLRSI